MARILIVDDEANICWALGAFLTGEGHEVDLAGTATEALERFQARPPDLIISDIRMPGAGGLEILERARALAPDVPVILMTAYGNVDAAVAAMHKGAFEYLHKPLDLDQVRALVARALAGRDARLSGSSGEAGVPDVDGPGRSRLVGRSVAMQEVYKLIALVSRSDATVLVEGESGVGKELVARAIHEYGRRRQGPFVAINCGSVPESLFESELFGHERGAFTGAVAPRPGRYERAHTGTLFLDEVAELPPAQQTALLRVLEDGRIERLGGTRPVEVDVRVIAATNRSLRDEVAARRFREDLYFRLQVVTIRVPPLRQRLEDVPELVAHFVQMATGETGQSLRGVSPAALSALCRYDWPGNVRELENAIRRAAVLARDGIIDREDLPREVAGEPRPAGGDGSLSLSVAAEAELRARLQGGRGAGSIYHELVEAVEAKLVATALAMTGGNQVRAADLLGVHRTTLRKRIQALSADAGP
ncbi:MAG: hypothetical protein A3F92_13975 [Candidatus Rokubacteria bacterium RIFCSPLOWO2_12_FULL_71_22]|nr:MAG: hypothetical protein A3F92_13975 [Candidatus Rokubacteria bacterium RIFCSPLOWO2_12_FULL_71_22]